MGMFYAHLLVLGTLDPFLMLVRKRGVFTVDCVADVVLALKNIGYAPC